MASKKETVTAKLMYLNTRLQLWTNDLAGHAVWHAYNLQTLEELKLGDSIGQDENCVRLSFIVLLCKELHDQLSGQYIPKKYSAICSVLVSVLVVRTNTDLAVGKSPV
jgi:hypothetical protein